MEAPMEDQAPRADLHKSMLKIIATFTAEIERREKIARTCIVKGDAFTPDNVLQREMAQQLRPWRARLEVFRRRLIGDKRDPQEIDCPNCGGSGSVEEPGSEKVDCCGMCAGEGVVKTCPLHGEDLLSIDHSNGHRSYLCLGELTCGCTVDGDLVEHDCSILEDFGLSCGVCGGFFVVDGS